MHARVNSSSLARRGNLESENENLSFNQESVLRSRISNRFFHRSTNWKERLENE